MEVARLYESTSQLQALHMLQVVVAMRNGKHKSSRRPNTSSGMD